MAVGSAVERAQRPLTMGPVRSTLADGRRQHFNHGPIDLVIDAFGEGDERAAAHEQAWCRFATVLPELVSELPLLRQPVTSGGPSPRGPVARRMWQACWPHRSTFVTPMAAVAGAVADEVLEAMVADRRLERAYVNDGGDIALHLTPGSRFDSGIVSDVAMPAINGIAGISHADPVRGIATSGRSGRSFSLGIADSVTVLADNAAAADVAATLIANAVKADDPAIRRRPARELDPDSDLGDRPVTVEVGRIGSGAIDDALDNGATVAQAMLSASLIHAALLTLQGRTRIVGTMVRVGQAGSLAPLIAGSP